jgi:hypothetical protein
MLSGIGRFHLCSLTFVDERMGPEIGVGAIARMMAIS